MVINKGKKVYFADINENIDLNTIEKDLERILKEDNMSNTETFREEWDELQKISIIIEGYKKQVDNKTTNTKEKSEEERKIKNIYEIVERKKDETYFQIEKKMSEIEEKIGENFHSINKLNECQKQYYELEMMTKILEYEQGEKDIEEGKNICKERIEELRKKIRTEYRKRNSHEAFIRETEMKLKGDLRRKEIKYEKRAIRARIAT